jgi:hypothetical protein
MGSNRDKDLSAGEIFDDVKIYFSEEMFHKVFTDMYNRGEVLEPKAGKYVLR